MKIFSASVTLTFSLCLLSCKKNSDSTPQPTKTEQISASAWKVEDVGFDQDKNGSIEISALSALPSCVADNTISFNANNTGVTDEGAAKCNTTDPQSTTFNWSFADAEANINVSSSVLTQINGKSKVVVLTSTNMSLAKDTTVFGTSGWVVIKLKH